MCKQPQGRGFESHRGSHNNNIAAMVNGSNSASKYTIEAPHDESESIGCSAALI